MATLDNTYGALLVGVVLAAILCGCTWVQAWNYYTDYPWDRWYTKAFVALVLVTDTCHQAVITHAVYTYLVTYYGVVNQLEIIVPTMISEVFLNGFTTLFVQCFLAFRVYRFSSSLIAYGVVMIMVLVQFCLVLLYAIRASLYQTFAQLVALKTLSMTVNATAAAADLIIALFLCVLLHRSRTGSQNSDTVINKLIMFSINTSLLTSVCALVSLICISVWPQSFIYMTFYFIICRLYCNSLLATLNTRRGLLAKLRCAADSSFDDQTTHRLTNLERGGLWTSRARPNAISIKVDTMQEFIRDEVGVSERERASFKRSGRTDAPAALNAQMSLHGDNVRHPDPDIVVAV